MTIFLVGYMASGKTTLGRALASATGYEFIDLDFYITQRYRKTIPEIFSEKGEDEFRRLEGMMLREVGEFDNVVVSCGGGTPCHNNNMKYMNSVGETVLLDAGVECTVRRLLTAQTRRPIVEQVPKEELHAFVEKHKNSRMEHYIKAKHVLNSEDLESKKDIEKTIKKVCEILGLEPK